MAPKALSITAHQPNHSAAGSTQRGWSDGSESWRYTGLDTIWYSCRIFVIGRDGTCVPVDTMGQYNTMHRTVYDIGGRGYSAAGFLDCITLQWLRQIGLLSRKMFITFTEYKLCFHSGLLSNRSFLAGMPLKPLICIESLFSS